MNLRNEKLKQDQAVDKMRQDYMGVIDYLSEPRDWKSMVIRIAKENPEIIMKHIKVNEPIADKDGLTQNQRETIWKLIEGNKKIQAIKELRGMTGWGLKESKEYVDKMGCPYPF